MLKWSDIDEDQKLNEIWDSHPSYPVLQMTHAAHTVTKDLPPGYDGTTNWLKYSDAIEEWCDLTKVEVQSTLPAIAACLSGRAELFNERLDRD